MTNEEYSAVIAPLVTELKTLRQKALQLSAGVSGENLCDEDLPFCATLDRCVRLIDGFIPMLQARNLTCAGVLLRMQMDNCMRTYAAYITEDRESYVQAFLNGKNISKLKDVNGNKLTDAHLKSKMWQLDGRFKGVYENASGYVHCSSKAFFQMVGDIGDNGTEFLIGLPLPEKRNDVLLECADAYIHYVKLHFKLIQPVVESKRRFDIAHAGE